MKCLNYCSWVLLLSVVVACCSEAFGQEAPNFLESKSGSGDQDAAVDPVAPVLGEVREPILELCLPEPTQFNLKIPSPQEFLDRPVDNLHVRYSELVAYSQVISSLSDRVKAATYARSHGNRPLQVLVVTSPENHARLEDLRKAHLQISRNLKSDSPLADMPAVMWLGYTVHGDEASGAHAAMLMLYLLSGGESEWVHRVLKETILLIDPCLNPDGYDRFASWVNDNKGTIASADPEDREHRQPWPGGRTNYYGFDLNRDWMPAVQPESIGRLGLYYRWMPNVVLDFHEMGGDASYFFQPGAPGRYNPYTPPEVEKLTRRFADYHAASLDKAGRTYFTEERFDDFYPGKGSTFPDLHGSIGILFEQGSPRGHRMEFGRRVRTFGEAIGNQVLTTISSIQATIENRVELLEFQRQFYRDALAEAEASTTKAYLLKCPHDQQRLANFVKLMNRHHINIYHLADQQTTGSDASAKVWEADTTLVIPTKQPHYRFLQTMMETRTEFESTTFYDVSAWTIPLAFGLEYVTLDQDLPAESIGKAATFDSCLQPAKVLPEDAIGYAIDWRDQMAPKYLHKLLSAGADVRLFTQDVTLSISDSDEPISMPTGTLMVHRGLQPSTRMPIQKWLQTAIEQDQVTIHAIRSGLTIEGPDLGSGSLRLLEPRKIAMLVGSGTEAYGAGELWHFFDRRLRIPITRLDTDRLNRTDLDRYTTIIMPDGAYSDLSAASADQLKSWIANGGHLIALGTAGNWLSQSELLQSPAEAPLNGPLVDRLPQSVSGVILKMQLPSTSRIAYGFSSPEVAVFREHNLKISKKTQALTKLGTYSQDVCPSGSLGANSKLELAGSPSIVSLANGQGKVVWIVDNPIFRGYFEGSMRLLVNCVYLDY